MARGTRPVIAWHGRMPAEPPEFVDLAALQAGNAPPGVRRAGSQAPVDTRNGEYVSGNFFRTLGVQPWMGRLFTGQNDQQGAPPVAEHELFSEGEVICSNRTRFIHSGGPRRAGRRLRGVRATGRRGVR